MTKEEFLNELKEFKNISCIEEDDCVKIFESIPLSKEAKFTTLEPILTLQYKNSDILLNIGYKGWYDFLEKDESKNNKLIDLVERYSKNLALSYKFKLQGEYGDFYLCKIDEDRTCKFNQIEATKILLDVTSNKTSIKVEEVIEEKEDE